MESSNIRPSNWESIRHKSHLDERPYCKNVFKILLVAPNGVKDELIDEHLYNRINKKNEKIDEILKVMCDNSIENFIVKLYYQ